MTTLDHAPNYLRDRPASLPDPSVDEVDIEALKEIVIGLTARINELEFTMRYLAFPPR
jgi:hypothetical protein